MERRFAISTAIKCGTLNSLRSYEYQFLFYVFLILISYFSPNSVVYISSTSTLSPLRHLQTIYTNFLIVIASELSACTTESFTCTTETLTNNWENLLCTPKIYNFNRLIVYLRHLQTIYTNFPIIPSESFACNTKSFTCTT